MPRRSLARLLLVGVALLGSLAAVEVGFRLAGVGGPYDPRDLVFAWRPAAPFAPSATTGVRLMPGFRGEMVYVAADGAAVRSIPVRTNAEGLRGPEVPAVIDLLALGDSMTFGQGVSEDEAWPAVVGRLTGRATVNGGQPSWNLAQEALWFEATALRPRAVVVAWFANDLDAPGVFTGVDVRPHPLVAPDWARAAGSSSSWAVTWGLRVLSRRATAEAVLGEWTDYRVALTQRDGDPGVRARQRGAFGSIRATCTRLGVPCLVVTLPLLPVAEDPAVALLAAHAREDAMAMGLPAVDLTPVVASVPLERRIVYPSDPHPSAAMHEVIAGAVVREIGGW